eukprot:Gb_18140 [translate_table: standard]
MTKGITVVEYILQVIDLGENRDEGDVEPVDAEMAEEDEDGSTTVLGAIDGAGGKVTAVHNGEVTRAHGASDCGEVPTVDSVNCAFRRIPLRLSQMLMLNYYGLHLCPMLLLLLLLRCCPSNCTCFPNAWLLPCASRTGCSPPCTKNVIVGKVDGLNGGKTNNGSGRGESMTLCSNGNCVSSFSPLGVSDCSPPSIFNVSLLRNSPMMAQVVLYPMPFPMSLLFI